MSTPISKILGITTLSLAIVTGCRDEQPDPRKNRADTWEVEVPSPAGDPGPIVRFRYTEMAGVNAAIDLELDSNDCTLFVYAPCAWHYGFVWLDRLKVFGVHPRDLENGLLAIRFDLAADERRELVTILLEHAIWTRNSIDRNILDGSNFFMIVESDSFRRSLRFNNTRIDLIDPLQSWIVRIANKKFAQGYQLSAP